MAFIVALVMVGFAFWATLRLPPLHPVQLWTIPWALATTLFAARLLPYRTMHLVTAAIIVGANFAFVFGCIVGERTIAKRIELSRGQVAADQRSFAVPIAATLVLAGLVVTLVAFIMQLVRDFGVRAAFISSGNVRLAIGTGATSVTVKYVYFAFAAVVLTILAASCESDQRRSRRWIALGVLAALTMYFATGRSNIILAMLIGLLVWGVARPESITRSRIAITVGSVAIIGLFVFTIGGAIIGKTFAANEASTINSVFTSHKQLSVLAVPYEYLSAPIAGLQRQVELSTTWGSEQGCATVAFVCQILHHAGLDVYPEPAIRAATKPPLSWNAYTGLDFWLIDGGIALVALIAFAFGAIMGGLWAGVRSRHPSMIVLYAIFGSTLLFSAYQNTFFAPHIVGSAAICITALLAGRWLASRQLKTTDNGVTGAIRSS